MQVQSRTLLRGLRVKDVMSNQCKIVDPGSSLEDFVHQTLLPTGGRCFLVVRDSRPLGMITPSEVRAVDPEAWPYTSVQAAMLPADKIHFVSRDMPAMEALEIMGREDINQLPVLSDGRVEGVVTRAHLLQVLRSRAEVDALTNARRAA
jgi:CBS domain-containing protein